MDITYLGKSGVRISGKGVSILVDPAGTSAKIKDEVVILTDPKDASKLTAEGHMLIDGAGEYEVQGALIVGMPTKLRGGDPEKEEGSVYRIEVDNFKVAVVGNVAGKLSDEQAGELGEVEVLVVPVGGDETLSPSEASDIISQLEPKFVVPVAYDNLDAFFKEVGSHPETLPKLKLASKDLPLETTITPLAAD